MPTANDLIATYSFIAAFTAETELQKFGSNALPVYAVGLQLGVDDFASFGTEAVTDHSSDKKADIIYIDESEGVACIAQGYVSSDWGKQEAKANKASDLNTAVAWLLQKPIGEVPPQISAQAHLLREGLASKTIRKIVVAYAHNALESKNVGAELDAVRHLLNGLDVSKEADVEVVELGLRKTEALFLAAKGAIRIDDLIQLKSDSAIAGTTAQGWSAYTFSLNGAALHGLYEGFGDDLFSANLRDFLGARRNSVNVRIKQTVEKQPARFFVLNNGITIVTKKAEVDHATNIVKLHGVSIVNGAQTTGAIHAAGAEHAAKVSVLTRVITVSDEKLISEIVAGNNTQTSIVAWDRRSNDPVQVRIANEFKAKNIDYVHRRGSAHKPKSSVFADQIGQALCAFGGDLQTAIRAKADIFEVQATYNRVFPATISIGHIFAVQTLAWAYEAVKGELKQKADAAGGLTDIQERQFRLLDYPASKQFVIRMAGELREEISGHKLSDAQAFELASDFVLPASEHVVSAWMQVLRAILPTMTTDLPAQEYQVVRSDEHFSTVSKRTKAVVAGVPALQESFSSLRAMLKKP